MTVNFFGSVIEHTNGERSFEPGPCSSLRELSDALGSRYGESFAELMLSGACFFLVNGKGTAHTGGFDTSLKQGDQIDVLPFVDAG